MAAGPPAWYLIEGMATATRQGDRAPIEGIASLVERFDADVIHVPGGRARVRLE